MSICCRSLFMLSMAWAGFIPAHASPCPSMIGRWGYGPSCAITGDHEAIYVGSGTVLQIYGINEPGNPSLYSELALEGVILGLALDETQSHGFTSRGKNNFSWEQPASISTTGLKYLYVAASRAGLIIIDVSDSMNPFVTGTLNTPANATDIAVANGFAYMAVFEFYSSINESAGLYIANIDNSAHPEMLGFLNIPGASGIAINGTYAFLSAATHGVYSINVADPNAPFVLSQYDTPGWADKLSIDISSNSKRLAYVCDSSEGLLILDYSSPDTPIYVATVDAPGATQAQVVQGIAYIAAYYDGLWIYDVSNPVSPVYLGGAGGNRPGARAYGISATNNGHIYVADYIALWVLDVSLPQNPIETQYLFIGDSSSEIMAEGSVLFVSQSYGGMRILDFSDPAHPETLSVIPTQSMTFDAAISGALLYIADLYTFAIYDISNLKAPVQLSRIATSWQNRDVLVQDGYAYVLGFEKGLIVYDISNPTAPILVSQLDTSGYAADLAILNNYLLIADMQGGLCLVDIATPNSPKFEWCDTTLSFPRAVTVQDSVAYIADAGGTLIIYDFQTPLTPMLIGSIPLDGEPSSVALIGQYAFITAWYAGVRIVDLSNMTSPTEVGFIETPGWPYNAAVSGDTLFVADSDAGIEAFSVHPCGIHTRPLSPPN